MRPPDPRIAAVVLLGLAAATFGIVASNAPTIQPTPLLVLVVTVTAAVGELLPLPRVRGRDVPTSVAVVGTFALLGAPFWSVIGVSLAGRVVAAALHRRPGSFAPARMVRPVLGAWMGVGAVGLGSLLPWDRWAELTVHPGSAAVLAATIVIGLPWWESLGGDEDDEDGSVLRRLTARVEANWMTEVALASTAILGAVVYPKLYELAVPFVLLPVLAARAGLRGYLTVRLQHDQTIRAMSRLPEELGEVTAGHGQRTGELAATVARALRLSSIERQQLVQSGQLHELGRIRHEPDEEHTDRTIALNGASILHQSGLDAVATIVGTHRDHILGTGRAATILRLACELDLALTRTGDRTMALASVAEQLVQPSELRLLGAFDLEAVALP